VGINDVLGAIGDAVDKINKWTSLAPSGYEDKPLGSLDSSGLHVNNPFGDTSSVGTGKAAPAASGLNLGIESTMSGMRWLYSNGVSQPIATAALVNKLGRRNNNDPWGFDKDFFSAKSWTDSWHAANHISPGQALTLNPDEAKAAINSPLLYYKPPESYLPPGFDKLPDDQQQQLLKQAGMPAVGNAFIEKQRGNNAWFKYGTGAIDFSSATFLDPTANAVGVAGKVRRLSQVKEMPKGGWDGAQIDHLVNQSQMQKLMNGIWLNKDNPQLINNTALAQHSGMGPRFGAIVSKLQDPDELNLFIRTGMGDMRAMDELSMRNAEAALRLRSDTTRLSGLDLMRTRYSSMPAMQNLIDVETNRISQQIGSDRSLIDRYTSIVGDADAGIPSAANQIDALHVSKWSMQRAMDKTAAQNAYRAGPARGVGGRTKPVLDENGNPVLDEAGKPRVLSAGRPVTIQPGQPFITKASYTPTPIDTGYLKTQLWGAGDYFSGPVTLVRSLKNFHPNGYMRVDVLDKDSLNELRGHLARIPGIKESTRADILNKYLKTDTEAQRLDLLEDVGRLGAAKVAQKYGLKPEDGEEFYRKHQTMRLGELDNMQRYSAALRSPDDVAAGMPLHVDEFTIDGGKVKLSPFTVTRLANGHTFQDLDALGKVLARHGSKFDTLRTAMGTSRDAMEGFADYSSYLWKATTLFRLGYIPRVLGDDLASQWARAGTAAMALRGARGVKNAFHNIALSVTRPALEAREANARAGVGVAAEEMADLAPQIRKLEGRFATENAARTRDVALSAQRLQRAEARLANLDPAATPAQRNALQTFVQGKRNEVARANARAGSEVWPGKAADLQRLKDQHDFLSRYHDLGTRAADDYATQQLKVRQGTQAVEIDGKVFPAAFGGREGEYYHALTSADESVGNIFATNKQLMQGNLERSFNHGAKPISAAQDEIEHAKAWTHAINNVIMQDPLQRMMVQGRINSTEEAVRWMETTPAGLAYRKRLPKYLNDEDIAQSQRYEIDQYMHLPEIRMKALEEGGVSPDFLKQAAPDIIDRPDVHIGQVGQSQLHHANTLDRVIEKWYRFAATQPANKMSRHPLFNQFYEGHLKKITNQRKLQGQRDFTVGDVNAIAHASRQLALRDMRGLVFDIAHRSDAAAALRYISPFFSATAESFQRWGRVIADKPQIVGYAGNWYNAPAYNGAMQDLDGNTVNADGNTYIPIYPLKADGSPDYTKKPQVVKRQVPKSERYIVTRVPKWFAESPLGAAFNVQQAGGKLALSQNSMDMVTQGDPWFNPGVGPIVQIPVNELVKDKPRAAEMAREFGVLPFGVQGGGTFGDSPIGRAANMATPAQFRNFLTAFDTSDTRYQQIKLQIMQKAIFEHEELGKPMLSAQQIADKTRNYWLFSASSSFLQPVATQRKDPYQFYRDQYNGLRNQNPLTADDQFLERYGESYFIFAQEISKSVGVQPTMKAIGLARKYSKEIEKNPDLAALVIGPEGNGPFSPEAYQYELNNPLTPGGAEMMRTKMSADDAMKENQRRLGWAKYTAKMNTVTASLHKAGFASFADAGAEDFADQKKAWTSLYAEPLYPDGTPNPYYNAEWSKDFFTTDQRKYERLIPGLTQIANSDLAKLPARSDLRMLQQYLGGRKALLGQLNTLKAANEPHTLAAAANVDLKNQWISFVDGLVEADTRFGDLYHRYLARDMGVDAEEEAQ
jgi:hypothetical protein